MHSQGEEVQEVNTQLWYQQVCSGPHLQALSYLRCSALLNQYMIIL